MFLLWPFLAFITALSNYSQKEARIVVYIFLIYFGLTFFLKEEGFTREGYFDAVGYALDLQDNAALPFSDFFKIVGGIYTEESSVDFIEPLISFIVSRLTDDYRFLFAAFAAVLVALFINLPW